MCDDNGDSYDDDVDNDDADAALMMMIMKRKMNGAYHQRKMTIKRPTKKK